ncbi:MAG: aspartate kinase [Gammaproteobacteria bacterium]|nr:MAG: aspartate kinase [Gammaproteobacteria bacterium]RTZ59603.1 MAG: aspartate kinase [Gammaproteobacteria bacterium]
MALIVQKYGGTSVGTVGRINHVADMVSARRKAGDDLVVVVSAMSGETNRLTELARQINPDASAREMDVLLSTGEQVTIALLTIALHQRDCPAVSYTGRQVGIVTDNVHSKARIKSIDHAGVRRDLDQGKVVVVAGFQGVDEQQNITTLGRGGSDTTAVALAAALAADECQIYTDVDGIYTADPRIIPDARRMKSVTVEEMLELAGLGAKVLHLRSVELAGKYRVPLRVLSSFEEGDGTLITYEDESMEQALVSGVTCNSNEAKLTITGVPDQPGIAYRILAPISNAHIDVDMIIQNVGDDGATDFTFTVSRIDYEKAIAILLDVAKKVSADNVKGDRDIAKVSVVGVGMRSNPGIATTVFKALADEDINIQMISTSEIKISVVVSEPEMKKAANVLHSAFQLSGEVSREEGKCA